MDSGCWPLIKQRPFDVIANPEVLPKSIFISCFDSAPLGVDFEFILKDQVESFKFGLDVLKKITSGNLNIGLGADQKFLHSELNDFNKNTFSGPHPAGNVGIHIHHLDPISQGESVWVIKPEDVCIIGNLFKTGEYNPSRTVAVSGPPVKNPMYFKTTIGTKLSAILKSIEFDKTNKTNPNYKKPFYSYVFSVLYSILWVYINIYFEPNGVITFFRYSSLLYLLHVFLQTKNLILPPLTAFVSA